MREKLQLAIRNNFVGEDSTGKSYHLIFPQHVWRHCGGTYRKMLCSPLRKWAATVMQTGMELAFTALKQFF